MTKKIHMSPTRAFNFASNPLRALEDYLGETEWFEGDGQEALLYGTLVHNIAEGRDMLRGISDDDRAFLISSRGKTKGELKTAYKEAKIVGNHLRDYVMQITDQADFEHELKEPNEIFVGNNDAIKFDVTGRADMLTSNKVYDFKTVAPTDFQGFLEYGTFRDHREVNYVRQVAFYAHMFSKNEAHILYIQKHKQKPFIYDYKLTANDLYEGWLSISELMTEAVKVIVNGKKQAKAVNDGSVWAFNHFGGVINDN